MTQNEPPSEEQIVLAHGGGGELTRRLIQERFLSRLSNPLLDPLTDSAILSVSSRIAFTTDAFVVQPLEFPGGDIGRLAVCGTVNDLAVAGAIPKALSLAVVMEEGLELALLDRVIRSIAQAASEAGVAIATGDTKVIERHGGDGLIITTAGVGDVREGARLGPDRLEPGDAVIVTGPIAEHGLAIISVREGLGFNTQLTSDVAPLAGLVDAMFKSGADIKFLRDPTRGGMAGVLADLAEESQLTVEVIEDSIPITPVARHTAELLGLDPLTVANEGKVVALVAGKDAGRLLQACHNHPLGRQAAVIGRIIRRDPPLVELVTTAGGRRIIQRPYGEDLPRIC
ncbi:MAG: hydrogenase expression/formation protein HypE [Phycisphaerae bacterium]